MYNAAKTQKKCINVAGDLQFELHQKTLPLYHIKIVTSGALVILWNTQEKFFENMSMEGRMTVCN
jgi:3-isopropylmalate/(R)-2-methylmalate dehydratase large subunit